MEHHFNSKRTFRYCTHGNPENADVLLVVLHGYGQLARYFIEKFEHISTEHIFIIAPEGMHRFYVSGTSGRVGASWMTKEDRDADILDNIYWLSELIESFNPERFRKKVILGFSQGGATAARLYNSGRIEFNHLIMWASVFPPDVEREKFVRTDTQGEGNYFVLGDQDEFFTDAERISTLSFYRSLGFITLEFSGKHVIDSQITTEVLSRIMEPEP